MVALRLGAAIFGVGTKGLGLFQLGANRLLILFQFLDALRGRPSGRFQPLSPGPDFGKLATKPIRLDMRILQAGYLLAVEGRQLFAARLGLGQGSSQFAGLGAQRLKASGDLRIGGTQVDQFDVAVAPRLELGFQRLTKLSKQGFKRAEATRHVGQLVQTVLDRLEALADDSSGVAAGSRSIGTAGLRAVSALAVAGQNPVDPG